MSKIHYSPTQKKENNHNTLMEDSHDQQHFIFFVDYQRLTMNYYDIYPAGMMALKISRPQPYHYGHQRGPWIFQHGPRSKRKDFSEIMGLCEDHALELISFFVGSFCFIPLQQKPNSILPKLLRGSSHES
jgi:hypothetical protein